MEHPDHKRNTTYIPGIQDGAGNPAHRSTDSGSGNNPGAGAHLPGDNLAGAGAVYESELTWLSTRALACAIASGQISAREAAWDHFARIDAVNPAINAVVTQVREQALSQAARADELRSSAAKLPPLHGVPMTHKDTNDTAGIRTTMGSPMFSKRVPTTSALVIKRLNQAGVISTGKSNVPEFAAGSHTFNPVFGTTVNPYDRTKSAGGSSGGAAAAIAAGIQASGDGSDMGGSLRTPGSFNNIVGFRPSYGRVPTLAPGNPFAWLSTCGYMARSVSDVALLMSVGAGFHPHHPGSYRTSGAVFDLPEFKLHHDYQPKLEGTTVGFSVDVGGQVPVEPAVVSVIETAAQVLADLGANVVPAAPNLQDADKVFTVTRAFEFAAVHRATIEREEKQRAAGVENWQLLKDFIRWNAQLGLDLRITDLLDRDAARVRLLESTNRFFDEHDFFVTTASAVQPFDAGLEFPTQVNGQPMETYLDWMRAATLISATGCPCISVPAGFSQDGLPVGVQIVAAPGRDVELLQIAHAFETATRHAEHHPVF